MNPNKQVIEDAIRDLRQNRKMVSQIYEEWKSIAQTPNYYRRSRELDDAMEKAREERRNIAVRLFRDYVDSQGNPVVGNPNEAFYDPNPTPMFSVGDFHRGPGMPRTIPAITGAATIVASRGELTLRRIDKFIKQLSKKSRTRKDLRENITMKLTEEKLKQLIVEVLNEDRGVKEAKLNPTFFQDVMPKVTFTDRVFSDPEVDPKIKTMLRRALDNPTEDWAKEDIKQVDMLIRTLYPKYAEELDRYDSHQGSLEYEQEFEDFYKDAKRRLENEDEE